MVLKKEMCKCVITSEWMELLTSDLVEVLSTWYTLWGRRQSTKAHDSVSSLGYNSRMQWHCKFKFVTLVV